MDWLAIVIASLSLGVAVWGALSAHQSKAHAARSADEARRANELMVAYKDPSWILLVEPEPTVQFAGPPALELRLENRGESLGRDVSIEFDFDPTHLRIERSSWAVVDKNSHVSFMTGYLKDDPRQIPGYSEWDASVATNPSRNGATIRWTSAGGDDKSQRLTLPTTSDLASPKNGVV